MFELSTAALIFCLLVAVLFLGLWMYYDRRDHARFETERRRTTFHCIRCDRIYAVRGIQPLASCPHCGHENGKLRF